MSKPFGAMYCNVRINRLKWMEGKNELMNIHHNRYYIKRMFDVDLSVFVTSLVQ